MENHQKDTIYSVSQLTSTIKRLLENQLPELWVEGELSNFVHHRSGHMYFSLKDRDAQVRCVMFKGNNRNLVFKPSNGALVRVRGTVGVWPPQGSYQFYVNEMIPAGLGALHQAFEELKHQLNQEGLFDSRHKKPIPVFPHRIGVVTSPTGAAIRDIVNVISRRFPMVDLVLCPARVQGESASKEIVKAIKTLENLPPEERPDLLIVGRGGGSLEDLWPFNEEITARAIFNCSIPIISAVGHEIDYTIADFVADLRAPTPSAGAEEAVPDQVEVRASLSHFKQSLNRQISHRIKTHQLQLDRVHQSSIFQPRRILREHQMNLDRVHDLLSTGLQTQTYTAQRRFSRLREDFLAFRPDHQLNELKRQVKEKETRLQSAWISNTHTRKSQLNTVSLKLRLFNLNGFRNALKVVTAALHGHDPKAILTRGYAICTDAAGNIVSSINDTPPGVHVDVEVNDGVIACEVTNRRKSND